MREAGLPVGCNPILSWQRVLFPSFPECVPVFFSQIHKTHFEWIAKPCDLLSRPAERRP